MAHWISTAITSDAGWDHLETLVDCGPRLAGSEEERNAARGTCERFTEVGARNARLESFPLQGWARGTSALTPIHADEALDCIALPRSPSAAAAGELVDLGHGCPEDFETTECTDRIVMVATNVPAYYDRPVHRREKYRLAVDHGAVGFVFRNHSPGGLAPTGSVGTADEPIGQLPAVGVSKETGCRLTRRYEGDRVRLSVDAEITDATSHNVHAELGPDTDRSVLFTSHVDAHDLGEGAMDNGAGTAMLVALADTLAERTADLDTRVEFVAFGAEEVGLDGSKYHARETDVASVKVLVNLDGVVRGRTIKAWTHEFDELAAAIREAAGTFAHPVSVNPKAGPPGDQWPLLRWGVPAYFVASDRDVEGRGWGHTAADTLDKLDIRNFREQTLLLTELAVRLASDELHVDHKDSAEIAAMFERAGRAAELRSGDEWPFGDSTGAP